MLAGRSWVLTRQGCEIGQTGKPLLHEIDRDILAALVQTRLGR